MPKPGMRWRHVVINTHGSWLHGDDRGFRSREHRIHSSGDYKQPPPKGEHAGLHRYHENRSKSEVHIDYELRAVIGRAIILQLRALGFVVLSVSVGKIHAHCVTELPDDPATVKRIVGEAKRYSSRAVRKQLPGTVWSAPR